MREWGPAPGGLNGYLFGGILFGILAVGVGLVIWAAYLLAWLTR